MGAKTAITADDLIHMPRPENGRHYELSKGELIVVRNAGATHEWIKSLLLRPLFVYQHMHPQQGAVFAESQFTMAGAGARIPDIAFIGSEKLARFERGNRSIPFPPDLAIEIISDSETASYSETKVAEYIESGVLEIWQVYAEQRLVSVRTPELMRDLKAPDLLESPLLPGFSPPSLLFSKASEARSSRGFAPSGNFSAAPVSVQVHGGIFCYFEGEAARWPRQFSISLPTEPRKDSRKPKTCACWKDSARAPTGRMKS